MDMKLLGEIGLTPGEVKVYLALIEKGESTIGPISKKSGVTAAKVYPILEKLKEKGLVTHVIKSGTKHFQTLNPNRIIDFLTAKEKKINQQKKELKDIVKILAYRQEKEADQYTTIYETFNGIKTLYNEMLDYHTKTKEDFISFTLGDEYKSEQASLFFKNYDAKRKALGIKMRLIGIEYQRDFLLKEYGGNKNIKFRFLEYSLPTGVIIYGDNVVTLLWHKIPKAFVIHSKENAKVYRKFFEDMWKIAKP